MGVENLDSYNEMKPGFLQEMSGNIYTRSVSGCKLMSVM